MRAKRYERSEKGQIRAARYDASGLGWARRLVYESSTRRVTRLTRLR